MNFNFVKKYVLVSFVIIISQNVFADEYMTEDLIKKQCKIYLSGGHFSPSSEIAITQEMLDKRQISLNTDHFRQKDPAFVTDFKIRLYREVDTLTQKNYYRAGVNMMGISTEEAKGCEPRKPSTSLIKALDHVTGSKRTAIVLDHIDFKDEKNSESKKMKINFPGITSENNEFQMQIKCAK